MPSQFRSVLQWGEQNYQSSVVLYESSLNSAIEGCTVERIGELSRKIDNLDPFSEERDIFATIVLGGSAQLQLDRDGRVLLPKNLMNFAKIEDSAVFVGKGQIFEIWNPELFREYAHRAREKIKDIRGIFKNGS